MLNNSRSALPPFVLYASVVVCTAILSGRIPASETVQVLALCVGLTALPFAISQAALWFADHAIRLAIFKNAMDPTARIAEAVQRMDQPQRYLLAMVLNLDGDDIEGTNEPDDTGLVHLRPDLAVSRTAITDIIRQTHDGVLPAERTQPVEARTVYDALAEIGAINVARGSRPASVKDAQLWAEVCRLAK